MGRYGVGAERMGLLNTRRGIGGNPMPQPGAVVRLPHPDWPVHATRDDGTALCDSYVEEVLAGQVWPGELGIGYRRCADCRALTARG